MDSILKKNFVVIFYIVCMCIYFVRFISSGAEAEGAAAASGSGGLIVSRLLSASVVVGILYVTRLRNPL